MLWRNSTYLALQFIKAGANVNAVCGMFETPLHVAFRENKLAALETI